MDVESIFDVWNYNRENSENLGIQMKKVMRIVNNDFEDIITSSFKTGYSEGEKFGRDDESLVIRAKVISKLFSHTNFTDEDIFRIVGFQEEK